MQRRKFLILTGPGSLSLASRWTRFSGGAGGGQKPPAKPLSRLAGMSLEELHRRAQHDLFEVYLPFWDKHGVDHELGGFMCAMDHDGTLVNTDKFHWFQGRGIWVYSYLYNHFEKNPQYLEIARKTKDFLLKYAVQPDGWWAALLARDGRVLTPFQGDIYGMLFAAEGFQEYAQATGDSKSMDMAIRLMKQTFEYINRPGYRFMGTGEPGVRGMGLWMVNLLAATQILKKTHDPEIARIAEISVDAIVNKHYNPAIDLNNEMLNMDFSRPKGEETKSQFGHAIENYWIVMDEAERIKDEALFDLCAKRIKRHFEVGWDFLYGGLSMGINIDERCFEWPVEHPVFTQLEFREVGERSYVKCLWAHDEVLIALMKIIEKRGAAWASDYFDLCFKVIDEKFSVRSHGHPLWMYFTDRKFTYQEHVTRQENYHHPRQLMFVIEALKRMG